VSTQTGRCQRRRWRGGGLSVCVRAGAAQDAQNWWQRNKVEEGGGGYLGYGWDSAIWGVNVQLAYLTNNSAPQWAAEARRARAAPRPAPSVARRQRAAGGVPPAGCRHSTTRGPRRPCSCCAAGAERRARGRAHL